jgi:Ser/Thr protein kinase RdoA (MazF antagonist)
METQHLKHIVNCFKIDTQKITFRRITTGYINDTFLVFRSQNPLYILQRINNKVFKNVEALMLNIEMALDKLQSNDYSSIILLKTTEGKSFYKHNETYWRLMTFIDGSKTYNTTTNPKIAFEAGRIIGRFHSLLQDESFQNFADTIPNFNNLPFRATEFNNALIKTTETRKESVKNEIDFATKTLSKFDDFYRVSLPIRVCHNDTKLNNMLFNKTNKALCLIDLDTIMKGYFHYDFGDAVRTIVSETNEDEKDLTKIKFNTRLFEHFIDGINNYGTFLSPKEIEYLPIACAIMPFMHGLRALTDYLNGNIFYKITYENQNLDRCKSLFQFSGLALKNQESITSIIQKKLN